MNDQDAREVFEVVAGAVVAGIRDLISKGSLEAALNGTLATLSGFEFDGSPSGGASVKVCLDVEDEDTVVNISYRDGGDGFVFGGTVVAGGVCYIA